MQHGVLHVAAAAIVNGQGDVLLALRPPNKHLGGYWEFPGGKVESNEDVEAALKRELHEELGITIRNARPLIRVRHDYPERSVLLDVWRIDAFTGEPFGREGQQVVWVAPGELHNWRLPLADKPIVTALQLPDRYLITPEPHGALSAFLSNLERVVKEGVRLVQLRAKNLDEEAYRSLASPTLSLCRAIGARVLLNAPVDLVTSLDADGVHLTSRRLMSLSHRPLGDAYWVAASCHTPDEVRHACKIGVDFIVASPVLATLSHPDAPPLHWQGFRDLTELATVPVYALGGMDVVHMDDAVSNGGQGVAGIRSLWNV